MLLELRWASGSPGEICELPRLMPQASLRSLRLVVPVILPGDLDTGQSPRTTD